MVVGGWKERDQEVAGWEEAGWEANVYQLLASTSKLQTEAYDGAGWEAIALFFVVLLY